MSAKDSLMGRLLGSSDKFSDKQVAETLALLVEHGVKRGASDIHIEPHDRFVLIRYRIDGSLRGIHKLPRAALGSLIAEAKKQADLNTQETHIPQEGDYAKEIGDKQVHVRVATMPVFGGEKAVLHMSLDPGKPVDLAALGFWGDSLHTIQSVLANPHGLILVAGPRRSGISSTLFSLLQTLNTPMVSIATIESQGKHRLPGINQTHLQGGMSMFEGLQATLKQDPNIIMLDRLADGETAQAAIHAATTGHLVLAGLHAESSITATLRVQHAGVEPFLLVTALRVSIGQRLVRRLCPDCRERYELTDDARAEVEQSFGISTPTAHKRVHELERQAAPAIFGDVKQLNSSPTKITHLWRPSQHGCEACDHSGHKGQLAIVEVLKNSETLQKLLLAREPATAKTIQASVVKDGFIPLGLDGLIKALRGETTIAEVIRAVNL